MIFNITNAQKRPAIFVRIIIDKFRDLCYSKAKSKGGMTVRIAVCDDERICLSSAAAAAEEYQKQHPERSLRFEMFAHPEDLLEAAEKIGGYDIYILDVVMPGLDGIALGAKLRSAGYEGKIIYLTSSEEYSLDAFRVKAFDYLLKPINAEAFFRAMDEAVASIAEKKDKYLLIKAKNRIVKLSYDSILYAEYSRRSVCYHLLNGRTVSSVTLRTTFAEAMAELTADRRFILSGQSMAVNLDHITEIENEAVVFDFGYRAFLGEKNCRKLRSTWSKYLFEEG